MRSIDLHIWGPVHLVIHLIDIDFSDGNVQVGIEIKWR